MSLLGLVGAGGETSLKEAVRKGLERALRSCSSSRMLRQNYRPQRLLLIQRGFCMSLEEVSLYLY